MRRGSALKGLKSMFSHAEHNIKAFFGWREHDEQAEQEASAVTVQATEEDVKKPKKNDDGGDDGESGGEPVVVRRRRRRARATDADKEKPESWPEREGCDRLKDYATPAVEVLRGCRRCKQEQLLEQKRCEKAERRYAKCLREQRSQVQRQRVIRADADTKVRVERSHETPERLKALLPVEEPAKDASDDYGF